MASISDHPGAVVDPDIHDPTAQFPLQQSVCSIAARLLPARGLDHSAVRDQCLSGRQCDRSGVHEAAGGGGLQRAAVPVPAYDHRLHRGLYVQGGVLEAGGDIPVQHPHHGVYE